jgi:hypothetical protein
MGWQDIIALIGAAAWIPQIIEWINKALVKPKVEILSAQTVQIGYSDYGPHVVWPMSFSAEHQDALVKKIVLTVRHSKGEVRSFIWDYVKETFFQLQAGSDVGEFAKPSEVLALKISVLTLTERSIVFKDSELQKDLRSRLAQVTDYHKYSPTQDRNPEALMKVKEVIQAQEFFANNMYWKEGDYTFEVEMQIVGRESHRQSFTVTFRRENIESLQTNIPLFQSHLRAITIGEQEPIKWSYVRLPITPVD